MSYWASVAAKCGSSIESLLLAMDLCGIAIDCILAKLRIGRADDDGSTYLRHEFDSDLFVCTGMGGETMLRFGSMGSLSSNDMICVRLLPVDLRSFVTAGTAIIISDERFLYSATVSVLSSRLSTVIANKMEPSPAAIDGSKLVASLSRINAHGSNLISRPFTSLSQIRMYRSRARSLRAARTRARTLP